MTLMEAIEARHSVRAYKDIPIAQDVRDQLDAFVSSCNDESGLNITVVYDDPEGFDSRLAHYGSFSNVNNYIVLKGKKRADFDFVCGYYGEKIVLKAQQLGLNTCWAAMTFNKKKVRTLIPEGEKLCMVISLGYGGTQGHPHKGKSMFDVIDVKGGMPEWFVAGVEAALKAPTAMNQQKFCFMLENDEPSVKIKGLGTFTKVDLGIVAYHFEAVTGKRVKA
ncbi:MAG: nitroreductase [Mogibacterium sp.]|nr:nitroreductase [Mogibacterium sp.]